MQIYKAPIADMKFQLAAFGHAEVQALPPFADYDLEMVGALLEQAGSFATKVLLPLNRSGDEQGLSWDPATGAVTTPEGFKAAYAQMVDNGYVDICAPAAYGGGGGPVSVGVLLSEMWTSSNKSFSMCPGLTSGLVEALEQHADEQLKQSYLPKLATGSWAGTMCLTEPQCGTDLGLVRSKAVPFENHHKLTGNKIWITFGEHDLSENIVHFVLARLPDAPVGIKGISAFVVPKITLDGRRNAVRCSGLEHKMGINASPTCVLDFEDAEAWLVGEPHKGMRAMFTMMNGARLMVGMEGVAMSEIAYQTALAFARERRQSRSLDPSKREAEAPADNILVHPDVRRMLLTVKSTTEAMRGLCTWAAIEIDLSHHHPDEARRQQADDLVGLLTPIIKSYCTDRGFLNTSEAMQVCGGAGYTRDWCIEQYLRDVRIGGIYEGTNHVQALDLVGRKLPRHGGRALNTFAGRLQAQLAAQKDLEEMKPLGEALGASLGRLMAITGELAGKGMADPEHAAAVASSYLHLFALTALGHAWCVQVAHALRGDDEALATRKLKTARYFFEVMLPEQLALEAAIRAGKDAIMDLGPDEL